MSDPKISVTCTDLHYDRTISEKLPVPFALEGLKAGQKYTARVEAFTTSSSQPFRLLTEFDGKATDVTVPLRAEQKVYHPVTRKLRITAEVEGVALEPVMLRVFEGTPFAEFFPANAIFRTEQIRVNHGVRDSFSQPDPRVIVDDPRLKLGQTVKLRALFPERLTDTPLANMATVAPIEWTKMHSQAASAVIKTPSSPTPIYDLSACFSAAGNDGGRHTIGFSYAGEQKKPVEVFVAEKAPNASVSIVGRASLAHPSGFLASGAIVAGAAVGSYYPLKKAEMLLTATFPDNTSFTQVIPLHFTDSPTNQRASAAVFFQPMNLPKGTRLKATLTASNNIPGSDISKEETFVI